jgi:hypothetical protein
MMRPLRFLLSGRYQFIFLLSVFLPLKICLGILIGQVPDTQQPTTGSLGNPINNACAPVSVVNITQYWDVVRTHPNAFHVNAALIPKTAADYIAYFVDQSNWGSPVRLNGTVYPAAAGTYSADIMPGFFEFVRWDALHLFTTPPPPLPVQKLGYDWTYTSDYVASFPNHMASIDNGRPDVLCFRYWNPINSGVTQIDVPSGEVITFYTWGPIVSGSSSPNPTEQWNLNYSQECIGHAVTGVGYYVNYDPDGGGPLPLTNWFICHDNWSTTAMDVALPWANWAATITGDPGAVLLPSIVVSPDSIYHSQLINTSVTYPGDFTISNTGTAALTYTATNTLAWITFTGMSGNIAPGGADAVNVIVNTTGIAVGIYIDSVTISSNDPVHPIIHKPKIVIDVRLPQIDTCNYYKLPYLDYAPNGMPDFDQKQANWINQQSGRFSWCGPVALANCLWWFDSKFEINPVDPRPFYPGGPPLNDNYPLVTTFGPWDDHDFNNVIPFINQLGPMCGVDGPSQGTMLPNLQAGFISWLAMKGLSGAYNSQIVMGPPFQLLRDSILDSQDVILLLGFYEILPNQTCQWLGGHYVTCAGVCTQVPSICISDPFLDSNEGEPPPGTAHGSAVHNDAFFVSGPHGTINHDRFNMTPVLSPCPGSPATWAMVDYPNRWTQDGIINFWNQNPYGPIVAGQYQGGQILVNIDAAMIICPAPPHVPDINVLPESLFYQQNSHRVMSYTDQIIICNNGTGNLNISGITSDLSWVTPGAFASALLPGQCDSVDVTINTNAISPGLYTGRFHVSSDDPDESIVDKPFYSVRVIEPNIAVAPDSIYHLQLINTIVTYPGDFQIRNTGTAILTYVASNTLPWINLGGLTGSIVPGGADIINISVNTTGIAAGIYLDSVTINSNDPDTPILHKPKIVIDVRLPEIDICNYYKSPYLDYAPNGMPDFDQKQDNWINPQTQRASWCGPVALANCLWWFDSKFEPAPVDPRPFYPGGTPANDHYPLVPPFGNWDDHDPNNVIPFITALGPMCAVDGPSAGTMLPNLQVGFNNWINQSGLQGQYTSVILMGPDYPTLRDSILHSQDVILLLGFYEIVGGQGCQWLGGHYVTAAGVCSLETAICISDPFFDSNEGEPPPGSAHGPAVHNNAFNVSGPHGTINHDRFNMIPVPLPCPGSPATWSLTDYPNRWTQDGIFTFWNENQWGPIVAAPYQGGQIMVALDAALIICSVPQQHVPDINVVPDSLFHSQQTNTSLVYPNDFTISNGGTGVLNYTTSNALAWVVLSGMSGSIPPGNSDPINITVNTTGIAAGIYTDVVQITSNDPDTPVLYKPKIVIQVTPAGSICDVVPGDANGSGIFNGIDVTYSVNYLKGIGPIPPDTCNCPPWGTIRAAADANGSCAFNGIDVTYSVNYLKGLGGPPVLCPDCPTLLIIPTSTSGNEEIKLPK